MASFSIAHIDDNQEGWGPTTVPDKFKDIPYYAPFNKGDKLGKAADWQQQQYQTSKGKYQKEAGPVNTIFNYYYQDDDSSFQVVDNTKAPQKKGFRQRFQNRGYQQFNKKTQGGNWQQTTNSKQKQPMQSKKQQLNRYYNKTSRWGQDNTGSRKREASIQVKENWELIEEIDFHVLTKLTGSDEPQPTDLKSCGTLEHYNKIFDRVTAKNEVLLERTDRVFFNVTTSDDPVIRQLSMDGSGTVFATDVILAHLMTCPRSVAPWDILVQKVGSKLFFDKRDGSIFDFVTVNETAAEPPIEDSRDSLNSASSLMKEATFINQNFSQQVLSKEEPALKFPDANPFQSEGQDVAAVGYKYRKWDLGEHVVVARCEVDGLSQQKDKDTTLTIRALNEYDPKYTGDWRKRIDTQRGAVLATELKNNSSKLAKWTMQALLVGSESIKLGYVSRSSPKDLSNHVILAVQDYKPKEFATQISLGQKNAWAILKRVIDMCMKQPTGKYILLKDPERLSVKLYSVPQEAFDKLIPTDSGNTR